MIGDIIRREIYVALVAGSYTKIVDDCKERNIRRRSLIIENSSASSTYVFLRFGGENVINYALQIDPGGSFVDTIGPDGYIYQGAIYATTPAGANIWLNGFEETYAT